jgi:hypothetical protein
MIMSFGKFVSVAALAVAMSLGPSGTMAASVSERICESDSGSWDQSSKTCEYPVEETKPGNNQGNATWESQETDTAHGNLKNPKSTEEVICDGPGGSEAKC